MGGKGDTTEPPDISQQGTATGSEQQMMMFMEMMKMMAMQQQQQQGPEQPTVANAPAVKTTKPVDWSEKVQELSAKAAVDYENDQRNKHGRSDTIHTSPLLDEDDDVTTTGSIVT